MLIGRDDELARIAAGLDDARLVTLTGPGGVGKTALARAAAAGWPAEQLYFAELAALDAGDLGDSVAGMLGFSSFAVLAKDVEIMPGLVVLDNCEHVLDAAAAVVDQLLAACDDLRVLVTSRERLDVPGELVVRVDPLGTDGSPSPAAQLFVDTATRRGLEITDDPAAIAELCRRLDGLPLALELAAARASALTAAEMLANLDPRLDLLARSRARGPERHRSLAATVAWSYQQLDPEVQGTFERLSVFRAPFTAEMAAAVDGRDGTAAALEVLVERSLLSHEPAGGTSWYRMLETIRAFAAERFEESGDREATEARYMDHVAVMAARLGELNAVADFSLPAELGRTYRHLHWAIDHALGTDDRARVAALAAPLWCLEDVGHQGEAADLLERVVASWPGPDESTNEIYGILGALHRTAGRAQRSDEAAAIAASGSGIGAAYGRRTLGQRARVEGRWDDALEQFAHGAAAARAAGRDSLATEIELHAALTRARAGDLDGAVAALESIAASGDRYALVAAWATDFLAYVLLARDPARADALARRLVAIGDEVADQWIAGSGHDTLAYARLLERDTPAAARHAAAAIECFTAIRNRTDVTLAFLAAAAVFVQTGDEETAQRVMATERQYAAGALGRFEEELLDRAGPLPEPDPAAAPLPVDEIVTGLRAVADRRDGRRPAPGNRFVREGDGWLVVYDGVEVRPRHSKGLADLARLLAKPGREIAALDLMDAAVVGGDAGAASDAAARRRYEQRVRELQDEMDTASSLGDVGRVERAQEELDALVDHLTAVYGLGGRERPQGQPAEKARSAVTWRIRSAIERLTEAHPALGGHLDRSVRTGRFCVYDPAEPVDWEV